MQAIVERRLWNQVIARGGLRRAADVVGWFGAVQAQEYTPAKWALGLRMAAGAVDADVERAFEDGRILRTHVMRPTWHFVTPADIRWMLELTAPRLRQVAAPYDRQLELDGRTVTRGIGVIERALRGGQHLTRTELGDRLERAGLAMRGQRLAHLAMHAELEGVICSGPRRGKQFTYALLAERAPRAQRLSRDEALAALGQRFFRSHGPATIRDFVWWSGLKTEEARQALDMIGARRQQVDAREYCTAGRVPRGAKRDHLVHLLPIYDEYLVAYRDREAVPHTTSTLSSNAGGVVTFQHALMIAGQVAGTWRLERKARTNLIRAFVRRRLSGRERQALGEAVDRYASFVAAPVSLSIG
jgi:winged helix DNA-binding protein